MADLKQDEPLYCVDPQKILDFSYTPRINAALEKYGEVQRIWEEEQSVADVSMDGVEEESERGDAEQQSDVEMGEEDDSGQEDHVNEEDD